MSEYAIITQNDESTWEDIKGEVYHYPNTYRRILTRGCKVIYYKGSLKNKIFEKERLSNEAHYFGHAEIGDSVVDPMSQKGDLFCEILKYHEFSKPVPIKIGHEYIEQIPETRKRNYWRFAVREIQKEIYQRIIELSGQAVVSKKRKLPILSGLFESTRKEGKKKLRFSTYYERNPINRQRAIEIHGLSCTVCQFNFEERYGHIGKGYIHVHHIRPISELNQEISIDPRNDLVVLCANCHSIVHRNKEHTLSIDELRKYIS